MSLFKKYLLLIIIAIAVYFGASFSLNKLVFIEVTDSHNIISKIESFFQSAINSSNTTAIDNGNTVKPKDINIRFTDQSTKRSKLSDLDKQCNTAILNAISDHSEIAQQAKEKACAHNR